jgi:uncharacterized RDD family membrane protein YckC
MTQPYDSAGQEQEAVRSGPEASGQPSGQWLPQAPPPGYSTPDVPDGMFYDNVSGLVLPQGTQLASHGRRIGAYFLAIPLWIVTLGIGYIIWGLIAWSKGTTPALQVLGMRCWHPDSREVPGFWRMVLRDVIGRIVDSILSIITALTSFILFLSTKERRALHDMVAGTVVLYDPNKVLQK